MKRIKLTRGMFALVDDQDFEILNSLSWYAQKIPHGRTYYAARKEKGKFVSMHRQIMGFPTIGDVDHIDQNGLNNQRLNLRVVSKSVNMRNVAVKRNSTSGTVGVSYEKGFNRYKAHITVNNKTITIGRFKNLSDAIQARKEAEKEYFT